MLREQAITVRQVHICGYRQENTECLIRVNFNLTPDLTLQYWGQPYVASGKYYDHKMIMDPMADKQVTGSGHLLLQSRNLIAVANSTILMKIIMELLIILSETTTSIISSSSRTL